MSDVITHPCKRCGIAIESPFAIHCTACSSRKNMNIIGTVLMDITFAELVTLYEDKKQRLEQLEKSLNDAFKPEDCSACDRDNNPEDGSTHMDHILALLKFGDRG